MDKERVKKLVRELIIELGEDPTREGLKDTPRRIADAYSEIFGAFIALLIAPLAEGVVSTIEFVGSLIGILGVVFMISGMFYKKEIIIQE